MTQQTADSNGMQDLAHVLYCLLYGDIPDEQAITNSGSFIAKFIPRHSFGTKPLADKERYARIAQAQRLFDQRAHFLVQWIDRFDKRGFPRSPAVARDFLQQYFVLFSQFPRLDQDVLCREAIFEVGSLLDHELLHPNTVDYYAYYFTVGGRGRLTIGDDVLDVAPSSFIIVPPTCECMLQRHPDAGNWNFYSGHFRLRPAWTDLVDWVQDFSTACRVRFDESLFRTLDEILLQLIATKAEADELAERLCENLMEQVLIRIKSVAPASNQARDRRVVRAVNYVLQHIEENISIGELAEHLGLSSSHLSSLFREEMGDSLVRWREGIRMEQAARLLQHTTFSIGEIGRRVGYDDQLYFSRKFKQLMGQSPSDYRQQSRQQLSMDPV